ncbi:MAG: histidine phosphatase family protein [Nitrosomonadales bacterium]|nr:histidine phosphatase family protein [Nitrosomonadales bacterium]
MNLISPCKLLCVALLALGLSLPAVAGGLDIYLVRHAQTVHNAGGPKDKVSENTFSEMGEAQVSQLTFAFRNREFDAVLVSPVERVLRTIQPYLEDHGVQGELWPELAECCWSRDRGNTEGGQLVTSGGIYLPPEIAAQFTFRDADSKFNYANRSYADGVAQVRQAIALLKARYFNSGKTILIVAHYHSGQVLLAELLGVERDSLPGLENARVNHLRQGADGRFTLLSNNVVPE